MGRNIKVEICVDSLESVLTIQRISEEFSHRVPWRIELCSNLISGGGLTPSMGLLRACKAAVPGLEVMVMIRPRVGPFVYSESELNTMEWDIDSFAREGVKGFVLGCLQEDGHVDMAAVFRLAEVIHRFHNLEVTFHRAFDLTPDWGHDYNSLQALPCIKRILTSGQAKNVTEGLNKLQYMIKMAPSIVHHSPQRPSILPGSGINADMLRDFLEQLPDIEEIHLSASEAVMSFAGPAVDRGAELGFGDGRTWELNEEKLRRVFQILSDLQDT